MERLGGVGRLVVVSYSVDLGFLAAQADRGLRGAAEVTVIADAACVRHSTALNRWRPPVPRLELVPVTLPNGRHFHPKAALLLGRRDATLFVGSGNCGFAGWRENGELWARLRLSEVGATPFHQFADLLTATAPYAPIDGSLIADILTRTAGRPVVADAPALLWRVASESALGDQLVASIAHHGKPCQLAVACPWFDRDGAALAWLLGQVEPRTATVHVQRSQLRHDPAGWTLPDTTTIHELHFARGPGRINFYHSILYLLRWESSAVAFIGSSACTRRSLRGQHPIGDAELLCRLPLTPEAADELATLVGT